MQGEIMKYQILLVVILAFLVSMGCGISGKISLDPESHEFYKTARLIMTKEEKDIFNHLPDQASRQEFIKDFWTKRDPDPDTEENEFKQEFFSRIEYANLHFHEGIPGWKTDRGRIFIYLGPPDKIEQRPFIRDPSIKGLIWWGYYRYQIGIEFVDTKGDGCYAISRQLGSIGNLLWAIDKAKFGQSFIPEGAKYLDFEARFDREKKEIEISIPVSSLSFREEDGILKAEFEFKIFVYDRKGLKKDILTPTRSFAEPEEEVLQLEDLVFNFPYDLKPGKYYFDVLVIGKERIGKARKIFKIKL
jgi:GWxTD domain-containing protein